MQKYTRRSILRYSLAASATGAIAATATTFTATTATAVTATAAATGAPAPGASSPPRKGRIHQSVCRWCYPNIPLPQLCAYAAEIGLKGIDLLQPEEYEVPGRYGLRCTMGYISGHSLGPGTALNRLEDHDEIERLFRSGIPRAAKAGVANVIAFSGWRKGISDEEGQRNTIAGLRRLAKIATDNGINICLELLNSKVDHPGYMCDHTAWGVRVMEEVNSPNVKLLYDIYHMQIMEGDLIATIQHNIRWIGHFHTGGVPGRHELDDSQEINWVGVMKAIAATGFNGYVAHEFRPAADPLTSLRQAVDLCDV